MGGSQLRMPVHKLVNWLIICIYLSMYMLYCLLMVNKCEYEQPCHERVELGLHATLCFDGQVEEKLQMLRQAIKRQTDILVQVHYRWQL